MKLKIKNVNTLLKVSFLFVMKLIYSNGVLFFADIQISIEKQIFGLYPPVLGRDRSMGWAKGRHEKECHFRVHHLTLIPSRTLWAPGHKAFQYLPGFDYRK